MATGQSRFGRLGSVEPEAVRAAWERTQKAIEHLLNLLRQNLGIESMAWLPSINALVVPVAYLATRGVREADINSLLRWFLLASTWQRYAGSSETALDQDLRRLREPDPFLGLLEEIRQTVGRLEVTATDLDDAGVQSPFFLVTYLACRQQGATDWWTGVKLNSTNLGTAHELELHHIFPSALVRDRYSQRDVNELANLAFLSRAANREIGMKEPREYLPGIPEERLRQQFIPLNRDLWGVDRFQDFLAARRELLATGINAVFRDLEAVPIPGPSEPSRQGGRERKEMAERHVLHLEFWQSLLERAKGKTSVHANIKPGKEHWISMGAGKSGLRYIYVISIDGGRVELYIDTGDAETNKSYFDRLPEHKEAIEEVFGVPLDWQRLDNKRASRIAYSIFHKGGLRN